MTPQYKEIWFEHHELERTPEVESLTVGALITTKRIRTAGFIVAYSVTQSGWLLYTRSAYRSNDLPLDTVLLVIWPVTVLIAAIWSGTTVNRRSSGRGEGDTGERGASLAERHVDDYRPAFTRYDRQALVGALVGLTALAWQFPGELDGTTVDGASSSRLAALAIGVMAIVWWGQRFIVGRRQSHPTLLLVRVDDALRTVGVSALTGVGYGIPLLVIGTLFWRLSVVHDPAGLVMLVVILVSIALFGGGVAMILGFGRLDNEVVIYRHRLRPAADLERDGAEA